MKNMLSKGRVLVNGKPCTAFDQPLKPGDRVEVLAKAVSISRAKTADARESVLKAGVGILYEDENYIVADKPSGLLTVSSARGSSAKNPKKEATLYALLNAYVKQEKRGLRKEALMDGRTPDRSTAKVWIVHRIDKGTSGAVVFAKNERAKELLQSRWKELVLEREYIAYVEGRVEKAQGAIQSWLLENPKSLKMMSFQEETRDAELAITHYRVLGFAKVGRNTYTRMAFSLESGRKNQIRVHSADIGHPIAGDEKYGAVSNPVRRLALHASTLVFRDPFSRKVVRTESPMPEVFSRFETI